MALPPWLPSLALAVHRNRRSHHARYVQLATVREDGRPSNRTLVFRGFLGDSSDLMFATDARSPKIAQIEQSPWAEACWYLPDTQEQFRILGRVNFVGADPDDAHLREARNGVWRELEGETRDTYAGPAPGELRVGKADKRAPGEHDPEQPHENFGLLILSPVTVDHLELSGTPHYRWIYTCDPLARWSGREVTP